MSKMEEALNTETILRTLATEADCYACGEGEREDLEEAITAAEREAERLRSGELVVVKGERLLSMMLTSGCQIVCPFTSTGKCMLPTAEDYEAQCIPAMLAHITGAEEE